MTKRPPIIDYATPHEKWGLPQLALIVTVAAIPFAVLLLVLFLEWGHG
jgi:hypothetical protein